MKKYENENIFLSVLFVLAKAKGDYMKLSVIKLLKHGINIQQDNNILIDFCCRVYKNWQDFLKNNTLHNCILCYPKNGVYSAVNGVVEVEYGISPAGKTGRKFLRWLTLEAQSLVWLREELELQHFVFQRHCQLLQVSKGLSDISYTYELLESENCINRQSLKIYKA